MKTRYETKKDKIMTETLFPKDRNINVMIDTDGKKIVLIHDIRFQGKRKINWKNVKSYLQEYVGTYYEIAESSEIIYCERLRNCILCVM